MSTLQTTGSPAKEQSGAIILSLSACADYGPCTHSYAEIVTGGLESAFNHFSGTELAPALDASSPEVCEPPRPPHQESNQFKREMHFAGDEKRFSVGMSVP